VGAVLLAGNGKAFSAGMDLEEILNLRLRDVDEVHEQLFTFGIRASKPLVAAVQGAAIAGGTGLAANAHVVVAAENALFGLTEIRLGLWPFLIFRSIAVAVGERRAVELSLTGRLFGAQDAVTWGLAHHVVKVEDLEAQALQIATDLAGACPTALRSGLMFVQEIRGRNWDESGQIARHIREQTLRSDDFREGVTAFLEKRPPKWPTLRE
jgi:enoyl-CoA hydratase/carnithine racemase